METSTSDSSTQNENPIITSDELFNWRPMGETSSLEVSYNSNTKTFKVDLKRWLDLMNSYALVPFNELDNDEDPAKRLENCTRRALVELLNSVPPRISGGF